MATSIRVSPTVTIEIEVVGAGNSDNGGRSLSIPTREALRWADLIDDPRSDEFKIDIGDTEFTVRFDGPGERERFAADLRAAAERQP